MPWAFRVANRTVGLKTYWVLAACAIGAASIGLSSCHLFDSLDSKRSSLVSVSWRVAGSGAGTPAYDGATAFFLSRDHFVVAIEGATGEQRWRTPTGTPGVSSVAPSCVLVGAFVSCGDSGIVAFRRVDGSVAWRFDIPAEQPGHFPLQTRNGVIFAGSYGRGTVYALDAATGVPRWIAPVLSSDANGVNIPQLSVDDDIVVGAFIRGTKPQTGGVVALDANTGSVRWITYFPKAAPDSTCGGISTALWQDHVFGSSTDGKIYRLNRSTGAIESFFPGVGRNANTGGLTTPVGEDLRAIVVSGSTLFAGSFGSWLIAYDLLQRRELWRIAAPSGSANAAAIVVDGGTVYLVTAGGTLTAFATTHPEVLWEFGDLNTPFVASVAVSPTTVFASGLTGFWALKR